jgi:hypothetical protein
VEGSLLPVGARFGFVRVRPGLAGDDEIGAIPQAICLETLPDQDESLEKIGLRLRTKLWK